MTFLGRTVRRKDVPRLTVLAVACVIVFIFVVTLLSTVYDILEVRSEIRGCNEAIAQKESELKQLEQKKAYYESEEFLEDAVRDGGYVGENETVFLIAD